MHLLFLKKLSSLSSFQLCLLLHLVVNLDLVLCHLDVLFNDAHFFLLLGPLEAEVSSVFITTLLTHSSRDWLGRGPEDLLLFLFKHVQLGIRLKVNLVLLVELNLKAHGRGD